jgi:valyl-tRNA synthetase
VRRDPAFRPEQAKLTINRWILTELTRCSTAMTASLEAYRFNEAAGTAYKFVWNLFCDWYLELLKPVFAGTDEAAKAESQSCVAYVLDAVYALLHPMMPFMTEELWAHAGEGTDRGLLCHAAWPTTDFADDDAAAEINWLVELVSGIRSVRSEMNVPAAAVAPLVAVGASAETRERLGRHDPAIRRLARVDEVAFSGEAPAQSAQLVVGETTFCLPLGALIDLSAEAARLRKEIGKLAADIDRIDKKLSNERFVANAPEEVVEADREKRAEFAASRERLETALSRIAPSA